MASLQRKSGTFYCQFLFQGKRHTVTIGKVSAHEADAFAGNVEHLLYQLRRGYAQLPADASITEFVLHNGRIPERPKPPASAKVSPEAFSLARLRDAYVAVHENGALEANSLYTLKMHLRHIERTFGPDFDVSKLEQRDLQRHISRRSKAKGVRGRPLSPATLRKEIASFRAVWNWAMHSGLLKSTFPNRGLVFPKYDERPPFQTREEIERQIERGGLTEAEIADLWDCLFLIGREIDQVLAEVKENASQPFVYPMLFMAAHTGARRSELLRCRITDVDFQSRTILIREKKRKHGVRTSRRVPITEPLARVLKDWIENDHPGGPILFAKHTHVARSRKKRTDAMPITRSEAHDHLRRTLSAGSWPMIRGWHVFRHSFVSNCVAAGVDQRMLDQWVGHTSEIRKRYQHLIPSNERSAIDAVFAAKPS